MTAAQAPAALGMFMLRGSGKGLWRLTLLMARQPLTAAGTIALVTGSLMAAANALYMQPLRHPAPLFAAPSQQMPRRFDPSGQDDYVVPEPPSQRPVVTPIPLPGDPGYTGSIGNGAPTGNPDVAALQQKLLRMNLFDGEVDGLYGPKTAEAIRAFERRSGQTPVGALTPQIFDLVRRAPLEPAQALTVAPRLTAQAQPQPPATSNELDPIGRLAMQVAQRNPEPAVEPAARATAPRVAPAANKELVKTIQKGLVRLGFLHSQIDGRFDEATARAIREFENYNNYRVTGKVAPELVDMLMSAGALN